LSSQVGRHAGVQTTEDGSLLLKPGLPRELAFYQFIRHGISPDMDAATVAASELKPLLRWIPKFLGVLYPAIGSPNGTTTMIVLENLTYGFHKPRIPDVKLGTVLYDEDVPPPKKERMICTSAHTTSPSTSVRLTGF
ncbi:hypothetical protein BKA82DRAFT_3956641, partial [Pisolithus tinctorius]